MAYGVQPYDPSKPFTPPKPSNPNVNSYGAPLQPPPTTGTIGPKVTPSQTSIQPPPTTGTIGPNVSTFNATNSSVSPALGYGGANYGNASDAVRQSIASNENKLNTDPAFVKSEYDRTNQVIESRKAQGLDITEQNNYLQGLNGRISKMDPVAKPVIAQPPTAQSKDYSQIMDSVRNNYMRDLQDKTSSIEQQLQQAIQASQLAVNQNNGQLQERVKQLQDMKAQNDDNILQFNNRFGGAYSGGTAYQRGVNADASTKAVSASTRDVDMRNQDIWGRNATLAQQAAENIQQLKSAAPDKIRELIRQAVNDERSFGLQEGQLTGNYNGTPTLAAKGQEFSQGIQQGQLTGQYNGAPTLAARDQTFNQGISESAVTGQYNGQPTYQSVQDAIKNGMTQQQIDNQAKQAAAQLGFNYDNMNADDKRAWAQIAISQQNADTNSTQANWGMNDQNPDNIYKNTQVEKVKAEIKQLGTTKPLATEDAIGVLNKSPFVSQDAKGKTMVDKKGMVQSIAGLGLPDTQMDALFNYYGISQSEVTDIEKQLRGNQ